MEIFLIELMCVIMMNFKHRRQHQRMADTVEVMKQKEQEAEETKNELITNVAHDLRTPLTSIIGYIDIVNNMPDLSEKQRSEYLKITWEKARKLEKLINELFSFTKISYGGMPMRMEKIDVIKMLEQERTNFIPHSKRTSWNVCWRQMPTVA